MPEEVAESPSRLVHELLRTLEEQNVSWCQWKSTIDLDRAASGASDLDLLVSRSDQPALLEIFGRLGFREADPPPEKAAAGVRSFFGYDPGAPRLIHAHVHYLLMVGHDLSKGYRLPLEADFISSSRMSGMFRVPAPDLEYIAFVIRMVLKRGTLDSILRGRKRLTARDAEELAWLESAADSSRVKRLVENRLHPLDLETLSRYRAALRPEASKWELWQAGRQLRRGMSIRSPRSPRADAAHRFAQAFSYRARRMRLGRSPRYTPAGGGFIVAAVGSDGAGKSTALRSIEDWLSRDLDVLRVHLGRPIWSRTTYLVRGGLKLGRIAARPFRPTSTGQASNTMDGRPPPALSELARLVCTARDRRRSYREAAAAAARGRIVLCDRYPLPGLVNMDGPEVGRLIDRDSARPVALLAAEYEERLYEPISAPDILFVLQLPARISLARKPEDNPERVARGSREVLEFDWSTTHAIVLDASRPAADIAAEMKQHIWREI
jgi:thymidylate kinase